MLFLNGQDWQSDSEIWINLDKVLVMRLDDSTTPPSFTVKLLSAEGYEYYHLEATAELYAQLKQLTAPSPKSKARVQQPVQVGNRADGIGEASERIDRTRSNSCCVKGEDSEA
jgi:hypothetical protein